MITNQKSKQANLTISSMEHPTSSLECNPA